jgi:hypothetical protein
MIRRPFPFISAMSLLLLMATAVLWIRSYFVVDDFLWQQRSPTRAAMWEGVVSRGRFFAIKIDGVWLANPGWKHAVSSGAVHVGVVGADLFSRLGFSISIQGAGPLYELASDGTPVLNTSMTPEPTQSLRAIGFPRWLPTALFALPPICWAIPRLFRRVHRTPGACRCCGYDLRASKDRCPECGTLIQAMQ